MQNKKASGLGRGLGDLLADNTPDTKTQKINVIVRKDGENRSSAAKNLYDQCEKPKNKSLKANYR